MLQHKVNTCCLYLFTSFIHLVKIEAVQDCDFNLSPLCSVNSALICRSVNDTKEAVNAVKQQMCISCKGLNFMLFSEPP